ncbi:MAG: hypothetical protein JO257_25800 [Deltaproteobacteria bacterium]|nr:hypothetical protein [Deltaproteobacteria bacterium]
MSAPDHPPVPRARASRARWIALAFAALVVGGYSLFAYTGREFSDPERDEVPASVRSSPGGYRSYHFWHSGYHGGK